MKREIKFRVWTGSQMVNDVTVGKDGVFWTSGIAEADSASLGNTTKYPDTSPVMQFAGFKDKKGKEIYEGDIIELPNEVNQKIRVICEFGTVQRELIGGSVNLCDITGFYFSLNGHATFPIVKNYKGLHDLELFEVVGNIYETPELLNN